MTPYWENENFKHNQIKGWHGIFLAEVDDIAFEGAKISGVIKEFDIELIQKLSKIYKLQSQYLKFGNSIFNRMLSINSDTKVLDVIGSIQLMTSDLLLYEKKLFQEIENLEQELLTIHFS